jgi:predicted DNA-binding protein
VSTLTIQLPDELKSHLSKVARKAGKTPAQLVRETIEKHLTAGNNHSPSGKSLYDLSADLCGSVRGGKGDLAMNKDHLNGYGAWKR